MATPGQSIRIEISSHFDMLDFVQLVSDHVGRISGLDEDATHWVGVAVRESVINAIKHGNAEDQSKRVIVEFVLEPLVHPTQLTVRVVDQGQGFDPIGLADPLAPENLLKSCGRGIFFMRSFMDALSLQRAPEGGMEVKMVKRLNGRE